MPIGPYLFNIANNNVSDNPGRTSAAPTLSPIDTSIIDVIKDFAWSNSVEETARLDVPQIILKEYNVTRSSLFQQARYLLSSTPDVASALQQVTKDIGVTKTIIAGAVLGATGAGIGKKIAGAVTGGALAALASTSVPTTLANAAVNVASRTGLTFQPNTNLKSYLKPYDQLYATKPTGFSYKFPYFVGDWKKSINGWESLNSTNTYNKFDSALKDISDTYNKGGLGGITGAGSLASFFPAAYFETPKMFKYSDGQGEDKTINFQLFNTTDNINDVIRNFQLCFLLMYQNRANRSSRVLVDTPVIYEIDIPGIYYCPFAYIKEIAITQLGATRKMAIDMSILDTTTSSQRSIQTSSGTIQANVRGVGNQIPTNNIISTFDTIIPDIYNVTITLTPLVSETKNLLYQALAGNNDSIYDVSVLPTT